MPGRLPTPAARWSCPDLGVSTFVRLPPTEVRHWARDDFGDPTVSRSGVSLEVRDGAWTVSNRSTAMRDVYLFDVRYGRRAVPPVGSLRPLRLRSWLLLPSSRGPDDPYVVGVVIEAPPTSPARATPVPLAGADDHHTENAGEPAGPALRDGLRRCRDVLADHAARDLLAVYARSYFTVSTGPPGPAGHRQAAVCLPGDASRGERLLTRLRTALWGRAAGQPPDVLVELLIRHRLLTHEDVAAVVHAPECGHVVTQLDPTAPTRRAAPCP